IPRCATTSRERPTSCPPSTTIASGGTSVPCTSTCPTGHCTMTPMPIWDRRLLPRYPSRSRCRADWSAKPPYGRSAVANQQHHGHHGRQDQQHQRQDRHAPPAKPADLLVIHLPSPSRVFAYRGASSLHGSSVLDVAVILNPGSGSGDGDEIATHLVQLFAAHGRAATILAAGPG